jgi:hypothetical protein
VVVVVVLGLGLGFAILLTCANVQALRSYRTMMSPSLPMQLLMPTCLGQNQTKRRQQEPRGNRMTGRAAKIQIIAQGKGSQLA